MEFEGTSLFEGKLVRLTAMEADKDAEIEARWTQDLDFMHLVSSRVARPCSPQQVKKNHAEDEKNQQEILHFAIRLIADERLVGFLRFHHIEWNHGIAWIKMGIASPADRGHGYGSEALQLAARYAFDELNMRRLQIHIPSYNIKGMELVRKFGFCEEVRRREAYLTAGQRWDAVLFGLLRSDWSASQAGQGGS